jgi:hypothetical protein
MWYESTRSAYDRKIKLDITRSAVYADRVAGLRDVSYQDLQELLLLFRVEVPSMSDVGPACWDGSA